MNEKMTAAIAFGILKQAIQATEYLERIAQDNDNAEGKVIAGQVALNEDVDLSRGFNSFKSHKKVSKTVSSLQGTLKYAELVMTHEAKVSAIATTATAAPKALAKGLVKA